MLQYILFVINHYTYTPECISHAWTLHTSHKWKLIQQIRQWQYLPMPAPTTIQVIWMFCITSTTPPSLLIPVQRGFNYQPLLDYYFQHPLYQDPRFDQKLKTFMNLNNIELFQQYAKNSFSTNMWSQDELISLLHRGALEQFIFLIRNNQSNLQPSDRWYQKLYRKYFGKWQTFPLHPTVVQYLVQHIQLSIHSAYCIAQAFPREWKTEYANQIKLLESCDSGYLEPTEERYEFFQSIHLKLIASEMYFKITIRLLLEYSSKLSISMFNSYLKLFQVKMEQIDFQRDVYDEENRVYDRIPLSIPWQHFRALYQYMHQTQQELHEFQDKLTAQGLPQLNIPWNEMEECIAFLRTICAAESFTSINIGTQTLTTMHWENEF